MGNEGGTKRALVPDLINATPLSSLIILNEIEAPNVAPVWVLRIG